MQDKEQYDKYVQQRERDFKIQMQKEKIKDELEQKKKEYIQMKKDAQNIRETLSKKVNDQK